ncbi:MAG: class I SAM-dependent methyltransferase [Rhizobiales bacterium]|nr:class I SAM-dependent methyltransferase [Hyphomicrobiales bacterium]
MIHPAAAPARPSYARLRAGDPPNTLATEAVAALGAERGRALDLGAGALADSRLLLRAGFAVTAVDCDPHSAALAGEVDDPDFTFVAADIRDVAIAPGAYRLILALHLLPMFERAEVDVLVPRIVAGLVPGGVLATTFFGTRDGWAGRRPKMTFLSRPGIEALFADLEPLSLAERSYDGTDATGRPKRWQVFRCLFRKPAARTGSGS